MNIFIIALGAAGLFALLISKSRKSRRESIDAMEDCDPFTDEDGD